MSAEFSYKDLTASDSIRLLLLQPRAASKDDEIHCNLQHTTLSECQTDPTLQYTALSYVWGNEEEQGTIFVEGAERHVTANLFRALRSIRHKSKELAFWVDAVCINQQNLTERSQQVRFMGSIYAAAWHTIIYLGESDENSDRAMEALRDDSSIYTLDYYETIRSCIVSSILSRGWFTRVWVLQELALSQNPIIQCGQSRVNWGRLPSFLSQVDEYLNQQANIASTPQPQLPKTEQLIMDMQEAREKSQIGNINRKLVQKHQTLLDLVTFRGLSRAATRLSLKEGVRNKDSTASPAQSNTVPIQQIPASTGPVTPVAQVDSNWTGQDITIDYEKTAAEVYNEFAQRAIENSGDLSITHHIQKTHPQPRLPGLASWAPDWTLREQQQIVPISGVLGKPAYILPQQHLVHTFVQGKPILGLLGNPVYCVRSTSQLIDLRSWDYTLNSDHEKQLSNIDTGVRLVTEKHIMLYRTTYERMRQKLGPKVLRPLVKHEIRDYYSQLDNYVRPNNFLWALGVSGIESETPSIADYLVRSISKQGERSIIKGRRVALLENGSNAFVPACAEKGDHMFVTNLNPVPVILREYKGPDDLSAEYSLRSHFDGYFKSRPDSELAPLRLFIPHYTFVGECFINERLLNIFGRNETRDYHHIIALH
ncbi:Heterokaryon incompatibility protein 6,OR allele [Lachnellula occidentalis]|uniref:Heterokaryon incompatibility protein 6,OR allele n=1 Tax=Lachnellula occidentalis TaxID=215460 RepID=A0A8H8S295_9HELO|nr:Heterokaryon incompatibility protein 6,OR allele [Lachnellula occidentalis]